MEFFTTALDIVLHLDQHLVEWTNRYGIWVYAILFVVIFAETGLVVTPFLPGDSLLFVAGSVAALGNMDVHVLVLVMFIAAILGNLVNYEFGRYFGAHYFVDKKSRWLNPEYIDRTHAFFERWGPAAVITARFVPFLRTYVPFVAGMGAMTRVRYVTYTFIGAATWVGSLTYLGYFFGNLPIIKKNLGLLVIAIIVVSVIPVLIATLRARAEKK
jgi:membrane-associated protein